MAKVFKIRQVAVKIPKGKATACGQVAKLAGISNPRVVGWALRGNQDPKIPCHRVIKAQGFLAENYSLGTWREQKRLLGAEGISFAGGNQVDLPKHLWRSSV